MTLMIFTWFANFDLHMYTFNQHFYWLCVVVVFSCGMTKVHCSFTLQWERERENIPNSQRCLINSVFVFFLFSSLLVSGKRRDAQIFLILSTIGHYSLFPLIFTPFGKGSNNAVFVCASLLVSVVYESAHTCVFFKHCCICVHTCLCIVWTVMYLCAHMHVYWLNGDVSVCIHAHVLFEHQRVSGAGQLSWYNVRNAKCNTDVGTNSLAWPGIFPPVNFKNRPSYFYSVHQPHVQLHTSTFVYRLKILITDSHTILWTHEILHMLVRLTSTSYQVTQISCKGSKNLFVCFLSGLCVVAAADVCKAMAWKIYFYALSSDVKKVHDFHKT